MFIALTVLVVLVLNASGELNPFKSHLHLRARFADANGLREGSDVKLAGVKIGKVDRLRLLSPSEVGTGSNPQKIEAFLTIETKIDGIPATDRIRRGEIACVIANDGPKKTAAMNVIAPNIGSTTERLGERYAKN